jgi:hypothetical protein
MDVFNHQPRLPSPPLPLEHQAGKKKTLRRGKRVELGEHFIAGHRRQLTQITLPGLAAPANSNHRLLLCDLCDLLLIVLALCELKAAKVAKVMG